MLKLLKKKQKVLTNKEEIINKLSLLKTQCNIVETEYRYQHISYKDYQHELLMIDKALDDIEMELAYNV